MNMSIFRICFSLFYPVQSIVCLVQMIVLEFEIKFIYVARMQDVILFIHTEIRLNFMKVKDRPVHSGSLCVARSRFEVEENMSTD